DGKRGCMIAGHKLVGPGAAEGKFGIGDSRNQATRWSRFNSFIGNCLAVLICFAPHTVAVMRWKLLVILDIWPPGWRTGNQFPNSFCRLIQSDRARDMMFLR